MPTTTATNKRFPTGLTCGKFKFKELFSYGDSNTTNLSFRGGNFDAAFYNNARAHCEMPEFVLYVDIEKQREPLANLVETHAQNEIWNMRVPIKLVGHLKNKQKNGEDGPLLTAGGKSIFLCRSRDDNSLEFVELWFENGSWKIQSQPYVPDMIINGPARLFVADR